MAGRVSGKIDMDGGQGLVLVLWSIISLLCLPQLAYDALLHSIAAQLDGTSHAAVADYDDRSLAWIHSIRPSSTIFFSLFFFLLLLVIIRSLHRKRSSSFLSSPAPRLPH